MHQYKVVVHVCSTMAILNVFTSDRYSWYFVCWRIVRPQSHPWASSRGCGFHCQLELVHCLFTMENMLLQTCCSMLLPVAPCCSIVRWIRKSLYFSSRGWWQCVDCTSVHLDPDLATWHGTIATRSDDNDNQPTNREGVPHRSNQRRRAPDLPIL